MTDSKSPRPDLAGLARSLDALFAESEGFDAATPPPEEGDSGPTPAESDAPGSSTPDLPDLPGAAPTLRAESIEEDVAWVAESAEPIEDVPAEHESPSAEEATSHDPLMREVATYLRAEPQDRPDLQGALQTAFDDAKSRNAGAPMMEAVEALFRAGARDPQTLELALGFVDHLVARLFAIRLAGVASDERLKDDELELISNFGTEMAVAVADELAEADEPSVRRVLIEAIVRLGEDAQPVLEEMVSDNRWWVVRNAVAILGQTGDESSVQHLTSTLANDDPKVRRETIGALARIGGEDASFLVMSKLQDADPGVRAAAARAVGELSAERGLKPLMEMLETDEDDVVEEVARALGQLGDPTAVNALEKRAVGSFFSKPPTEIRIAAYQALSAIGTPRAKQLLEDATEDKDVAVRTVVKGLIKAREEAKEAAEE